MLRHIIACRHSVNNYLETLEGSQPDVPNDKAITYAVFAIVGLLFLGALILGSMVLKLGGFE